MNLDKVVIFDIEIFPNYSLFAFRDTKTGKVVSIEMRGSNTTLGKDKETLKKILKNYTLVGFNSDNYDMPIMLHALQGKTVTDKDTIEDKTVEDLYNMSVDIIENNKIGWQTVQHYAIRTPKNIKHIDIMRPSPAIQISLKQHGARLHTLNLQDLPYDPHLPLTEEEMDKLKAYCVNDLVMTDELYNVLYERLELRKELSAQYNTNLMSKSDAQISEAVMKAELKRLAPSLDLTIKNKRG